MPEAPFRGDAPHADAAQWDRLIEAIGPDALLVVLEREMGAALRGAASSEDVWQEALILAWRDRAQHRWTGVREYRAWVLTIARNRIRDLARRVAAEKRGGAAGTRRFSEFDLPEDGGISALLPAGSTTPSRVAIHRERAELMRQTLSTLDPEYESVVRMHLFEERPMEQIAADLGIGVAAAWYRFRKGSEAYVRKLESLRSSVGGAGR